MKYKLLAACLALPLAVGILGSFVTIGSISTWYVTLNKPSFSPPNSLFAPVWTSLYILMGFALYLIWQKKMKGKDQPIKLFFIQLALNFLWSLIFFGLHNIGLALIEIGVLWVAVFYTIREFHRFSKNASYLLIPYLAWVSFAALLNLSLFLLNR